MATQSVRLRSIKDEMLEAEKAAMKAEQLEKVEEKAKAKKLKGKGTK